MAADGGSSVTLDDLRRAQALLLGDAPARVGRPRRERARRLPIVRNDGRERPVAENMKRYPKDVLHAGAMEFPLEEHPAAGFGRPETWGECAELGLGIVQPCPYVSCAMHLYLDVNETSGSITVRHPGREVHEIPDTCALAVAAREALTLEEVGQRTGLVRERVRQIEDRALAELRALADAFGIDDPHDPPMPKGAASWPKRATGGAP